MKLKILSSLFLALAMLASCKNDIPAPYRTEWPQAPYMTHAARYLNDNLSGEGALPAGAPERTFYTLTLTEGGTYVLVNSAVTDASTAQNPLPPVLAGEYTPLGDGAYLLSGFGMALIKNADPSGKAAGSRSEIYLCPDKFGMEQYEVHARVSGTLHEGDAFRRWNIAKVRITISTEGLNLSNDFVGGDLGEAAAFLERNGVILPGNIPTDTKAYALDISGLNEITLLYDNGKSDHATWSRFEDGVMRIRWDSENVGIGFGAESANVSFEGNYCIFSVQGTAESTRGQIDVTVKFILQLPKL